MSLLSSAVFPKPNTVPGAGNVLSNSYCVFQLHLCLINLSSNFLRFPDKISKFS